MNTPMSFNQKTKDYVRLTAIPRERQSEYAIINVRKAPGMTVQTLSKLGNFIAGFVPRLRHRWPNFQKSIMRFIRED